jgi:hypothetical protein
MGSHAGLTLRTVTDAPNLPGRRITKQNREDKAMKTGIRTRVYTSTMCILRLGLLSTLAAAGPLLAAATEAGGALQQQADSSTLVQIVPPATERLIDVNAATAGRVHSSLRLRHRAGYGRHGRRR